MLYQKEKAWFPSHRLKQKTLALFHLMSLSGSANSNINVASGAVKCSVCLGTDLAHLHHFVGGKKLPTVTSFTQRTK